MSRRTRTLALLAASGSVLALAAAPAQAALNPSQVVSCLATAVDTYGDTNIAQNPPPGPEIQLVNDVTSCPPAIEPF